MASGTGDSGDGEATDLLLAYIESFLESEPSFELGLAFGCAELLHHQEVSDVAELSALVRSACNGVNEAGEAFVHACVRGVCVRIDVRRSPRATESHLSGREPKRGREESGSMNAASRDPDVLLLALAVCWRAAGLGAYSSDSSFRGETEHLARKIVATLGRDAVKNHFVGQPDVVRWAFALGDVGADDEEELGSSRHHE